ncbi:MAG: sensor domain-containing diguanylate cyclase [Actinomycetota bacterium]|nr:sensor domain-containing diguanylate cyclase [Actinomycetota bacterium]
MVAIVAAVVRRCAEQARAAVWADYVHPSDMDLFESAHEAAHRTGRLDVQYRLVGADGSVRWVRDRGRLRIEDGRRLLDGAILDVTAIKATQAALETAVAAAHRAAQVDPLTGVWNRRSLDSHVTSLGDGPVGALMLDIDHFKAVNDGFGHAAGDAALIAAAIRLRETTSTSETVFRIGGDEFLLVLPGPLDDDALRDIAEALRDRFEHEPFTFQGQRLELTVSIGVARSEALAGDIDSLLAAADLGLYAAKRTGGNRVALSGGEANEELADAIPSAHRHEH